MNLVVAFPLGERSNYTLNDSCYWTKDMLFGEKSSVFVLTGKEKRLWNPSRMIWIRYDRGRSTKDLGYRQERKIQEDQTGQEHDMLIPPHGNSTEAGLDIKMFPDKT